MWKTSFPPGGVVSISLVIDLMPIPRVGRSAAVSMRCRRERQRRPKGQTTRVSRSQVGGHLRQDRAIFLRAAGGLGEDLAALRLGERVQLEVEGQFPLDTRA